MGSRERRLRRRSLEPVEFVVELPSDVRLIEAAVGYLVTRCREYSFSGPKLDLNFRVSITEAIANAMLYGNRSDPEKVVRIEVRLDSNKVIVNVIDQGEGFNPAAVPDPTKPPLLDSPGGRGLFLIRHLMDDIRFNERGNAVRMVLQREDPPRSAASAV